jgi:hypothetical protein
LPALTRGTSLKRRFLLAIALAALAIGAAAYAVAANTSPSRGQVAAEVGAWVRAHTNADDTILVWGVDAAIYLAADRDPAGRFPYDLPLVTRGYATPQLIEGWVSELAAAPPRVIVDSEAASGYWAEDDDFLRPPPPGTAGGRDLDLLEPFRDWARDRYVLAVEIDGRKVYARTER